MSKIRQCHIEDPRLPFSAVVSPAKLAKVSIQVLIAQAVIVSNDSTLE